ncbi:MAG: low-specificity L-threonine aldolase [Firmicutes bacterium]|nr:low-specificity L-threonine aldolase [Bacillota bacterium]
MSSEYRIDLRSDTVTKPTPQMRQAMASAEVGDDVYGEDPTVNRLEEKAAELMGKEAGLFVPSGSMGNQAAILAHTQRGDEVICDSEAHVFYYELATPAVAGGVQLFPVPNLHSEAGPAELEKAVRPESYLFPKSRLLCLENTHNRGGGTVTSLELMKTLYDKAKEHNLAVHLDGARIFNAATYLGVPAAEIARYADSVMFCLSKGLAAPVGSVLTGSKEFITKARKYRKLLGGGMRQAGILAAAGLVALDTMVERLAEDHANARLLAEGLAELPGVELDLSKVQTNIVICDIKKTGIEPGQFLAALEEKGVLATSFGAHLIRFTTHKDVSRNDILRALAVCREVLA